MIVLLEPGMVRSSLIPQWMTEPAAATLCIHTPPRISHDCLLALREVIDTVLGLTGEDLRAPVQANDPRSELRLKTPSLRHPNLSK